MECYSSAREASAVKSSSILSCSQSYFSLLRSCYAATRLNSSAEAASRFKTRARNRAQYGLAEASEFLFPAKILVFSKSLKKSLLVPLHNFCLNSEENLRNLDTVKYRVRISSTGGST